MHTFIAVFLAWLLAFPAIAQTKVHSVQEQAIGISRGASVEVRFLDGSKLRGRIGAVSDTGFELQTERKGSIENQKIAFDGVRSVRDRKHKTFGQSLGRGFLIAGVAAVAIAVIWRLACGENWCTG